MSKGFTVKQFTLEQMENDLNAIDSAPWRLVQDEFGDWVIWFHADLNSDPRRIILSYAEEPSENEKAAARFLVNSRAYVRELVDEVRYLRNALLDYRG